jgi:hypothetical protein
MPRARKLTCDCLRMMRDRIGGCLGAIEASGGRLRLSERLHQSGQVRRLFVTQLDGDRGRFAFNSDVQEHLNITPCVPSVEVFHIGKNVRLNAIDLTARGCAPSYPKSTMSHFAQSGAYCETISVSPCSGLRSCFATTLPAPSRRVISRFGFWATNCS